MEENYASENTYLRSSDQCSRVDETTSDFEPYGGNNKCKEVIKHNLNQYGGKEAGHRSLCAVGGGLGFLRGLAALAFSDCENDSEKHITDFE